MSTDAKPEELNEVLEPKVEDALPGESADVPEQKPLSQEEFEKFSNI